MKKLLFITLSTLLLCSCEKNTPGGGNKAVKERYQNVSYKIYDKDNLLWGVDVDSDNSTDYVITINQFVRANRYDYDKASSISNEFYIYTDNSMLLITYN